MCIQCHACYYCILLSSATFERVGSDTTLAEKEMVISNVEMTGLMIEIVAERDCEPSLPKFEELANPKIGSEKYMRY